LGFDILELKNTSRQGGNYDFNYMRGGGGCQYGFLIYPCYIVINDNELVPSSGLVETQILHISIAITAEISLIFLLLGIAIFLNCKHRHGGSWNFNYMRGIRLSMRFSDVSFVIL
jgi:hypothetical protein